LAITRNLLRRKGHAEALGKEVHVVTVMLVPGVAQVMAKLEVGGDARDWPALDLTGAIESLGRICAPSSVRQRLPRVSIRSEDDRVEIDAAPTRVSQYQARRKPRPLLGIVHEPQAPQNGGSALTLLALDDQVEVLVLARLLAEERVHSPAAVHPEAHACGSQAIEYLHYIGSVHLLPCR
jgi:hypothetical protein